MRGKGISKSGELAFQLRQQIENGDYQPGERLSSIRALSTRYDVGRQVVLSAFTILSEEGLVKCTVGSGTVVNPALRAKQQCHLGFVVLGDNLHNKFIDAVWKGLTRAVEGTRKHISIHENVNTTELLTMADTHDCILVIGNITFSAVELLKKHGRKFIVLGNHNFGEEYNSVSFLISTIVAEILNMDRGHKKSVGLIIGGIQLPVTRSLISEVERYSQRYGLPWNGSHVVCADSTYGVEEITFWWGKRHNWPKRLIVTLHTYLGFAQFLLENKVDRSEYPEITVMVDDKSFLPLPYPDLNAKVFNTDEGAVGASLIELSTDYIAGKVKEGFVCEFNPITKELQIKYTEGDYNEK